MKSSIIDNLSPKRIENLLVVSAFTIGALIRFLFVARASFPINDGGLFFTATTDLVKSNFALPVYITYNNLQIPFAYPPLGFYFAGILSKFFSFDLISVFHYLPALFSSFTIVPFFLITKEVFSKTVSLLSTFIFAVLPNGYVWLIMGGGVTRALGFMLSLLCVYFTIVFINKKTVTSFVLATITCSLVILSHLQWVVFALISAPILLVYSGNKIKSFYLDLIKIWGVAALATTAWWVTVIGHHGTPAFFSFMNNGVFPKKIIDLVSIVIVFVLPGPFFIISGLFVLGVLYGVYKKNYLLLFWFLLLNFVSPHTSANISSVPIAILAAVGYKGFLSPQQGNGHLLAKSSTKVYYPKRFYGVALLVLLILILHSILITRDVSSNRYSLSINYLSKESLSAMAWVRKNTGRSSSFLVITPFYNWAFDYVSEWFPALTKKGSLLTPQGTEWLPGNRFTETINMYNNSKKCYSVGVDCLIDIVDKKGKQFSYVYLHKPDELHKNYDSILRKELLDSDNFSQVYDGPGASIFSRSPAY